MRTDLIISTGLCQCGCGQPTKLAPQTINKIGQVKGQPLRFAQGHGKRKYNDGYTVDRETGCWNWNGAISNKGYGMRSEKSKWTYAHRSIYEQHKGSIPDGLELDHLCRNRQCVNPSHLDPVDRSTNVRRGAGTKLTASQVFDIRRRRSAGEPCKSIASAFNVSACHVSRICRKEKWR